MDRLFSKDLKPWEAHKVVMQELHEDEEIFRHNIEGSGIGLGKEGMGEKSAHCETV